MLYCDLLQKEPLVLSAFSAGDLMRSRCPPAELTRNALSHSALVIPHCHCHCVTASTTVATRETQTASFQHLFDQLTRGDGEAWVSDDISY